MDRLYLKDGYLKEAIHLESLYSALLHTYFLLTLFNNSGRQESPFKMFLFLT